MGQARKHIAQIGIGVNTAPTATLDDGVDNGTALAGISFPNEEPVFLSYGGRANGVFDHIVINLNPTVAQVHLEGRPLAPGKLDSLAQETLGQEPSNGSETNQCPPDPLDNRATLIGSHRFAQGWTGLFVAQDRLDAVEVLDLAQEPTADPGSLFTGLIEPPPNVSPASSQDNGVAASLGKAGICGVAVTLDCAFEVLWNDHVQTSGRPTGIPPKEHVLSRAADGPEIALFGFAVTRFQIFYRCFIDLHVSAGQDTGLDLLIDRHQPVGRQFHPASQRLARQVQTVPLRINLLLPIQRQMVTVFAHQHVSQQARSGQSAFLQAGRQGRGHWSAIRFGAMHEGATPGPPLEKTPRLIVQLLGNLLTNLAPVLGLSFDWLGINDLLDHRQVVRLPRRLGLSVAWRAWRLAGCNGLRLCRGWSFGQQQQLQLRRIELFTAGTKHAAHEQIHLLAQQLVFAQSRRQSLLGLGQLLGQFGFARCHSLRDPILCRAKCSKILKKVFVPGFTDPARTTDALSRPTSPLHQSTWPRLRLADRAWSCRARSSWARRKCFFPNALLVPISPFRPSTEF